MLDRTVDQNKRLDQQARADLQEVERALIVLAAAKADASKSAEAYAEWRVEHDAKVAERERLTVLIETLEAEIAAGDAAEAAAEFRKRYYARAAADQKLAARTNAEIARLNSIMLILARDHAEAAVERSIINQALPDDFVALVSADFLARGTPALPREVIQTERIWLWTNADSGSLVGDQDSVVDHGKGRGIIPPPEGLAAVTGGKTLRNKPCVRSLFDQITVHPEQTAERLIPIWQVRLVDPNGPRVLFDGTEITQPAEAIAALNRAIAGMAPKERPVEVELRPVEVVAAEEGSR